jgi:hypothetical protein
MSLQETQHRVNPQTQSINKWSRWQRNSLESRVFISYSPTFRLCVEVETGRPACMHVPGRPLRHHHAAARTSPSRSAVQAQQAQVLRRLYYPPIRYAKETMHVLERAVGNTLSVVR